MLEHYFEEFGHKCHLNFNERFDQINANKTSLQLWFLRNSIISKNLILLRSRPRSFAALRNEILCQLQNYPYALHPFSYITFYSEIIWMFAVFIIFVILPLEVFRYVSNSNFSSRCSLLVLNTVCIFDCIRRFFTGYLIKHNDRDEIVLDFRRITNNYRKTYFFIDLLSSIAQFLKLFFLSTPISFVIIESMGFLKFFRLGSMLGVLRNIMHFYQFRHGSITLITWIIRLTFIVHWISCFSVLAACIERLFDSSNYQWIDHFSEFKLQFLDQYIFCIHRSTSILTGTGFKFNSVPHAVNDMLFTIFTAVLGHILSLVIIGKVFVMVQGMRGSSAAYEAMLNEVSQYIRHHSLIQETTQNKIKTYYGYKYEHSFFKEKAILGAIPSVLREKIMLHCAKLVLENVEIFKALPARVVANLISHLGKEIVLSGDVIYHCWDKGYSMFFIESGTVAGFTSKGREVIHLEDGSYFGEFFITDRSVNNVRLTTKVAIETCELFELKSKDYFPLLEYCPDIVSQMEFSSYERSEKYSCIDERYQQMLKKEIKSQEQVEQPPSSYF